MVTVPDATPVTSPVVFTVAVPVALLLHVPPVSVGAIVMLEATQTVVGPDKVPVAGNGFTVTACVAKAVLQPVETV